MACKESDPYCKPTLMNSRMYLKREGWLRHTRCKHLRLLWPLNSADLQLTKNWWLVNLQLEFDGGGIRGHCTKVEGALLARNY